MRFSPTSAADGYTILELLIVMAIMGLLAALAAPAAQQAVAAATLRADTRSLVAALRQAQHRAVDEQRTFGVSPSADGAALIVSNGDTVNLEPGATISFGGEERGIAFYPDGTTTGGALRLQEGGRVREVDVAWLTGTISIGDGT